MQLQIIDGYITGYAEQGGFENGIEAGAGLAASLEPEKIGFYRYENGEAVLDEAKWDAHVQTVQEEILRQKYIPSPEQSAAAVSRMMLAQLALDDDCRLQVSGLYMDWTPGIYNAGDVRNAGAQTWECFQAHDNAAHPDIAPGNAAWFTFWRPLHGRSSQTARPFVPVQGAHDIYRAGEFAVWTDGTTYRCLSDTAFSPADQPGAWERMEEP